MGGPASAATGVAAHAFLDPEHAGAPVEQTDPSYHALLEALPDAFFALDLEGRVRDCNEVFARRCGRARGELLDRPVDELGLGPLGDDVRRHLADIVVLDRARFASTQLSRDGRSWRADVHLSYVRLYGGRVFVVLREICAEDLSLVVLRSRLDLLEAARRGSTDDLLQRTLDTAEELTGSSIGFFHFVDADQQSLTLQAWSTNTLAHLCRAEGKGQHYPVAQAGVWADCVHTGAPVIHNDYASLPHKKGLPPGHAPVVRELTVPIIREGRVWAVVGVGNKPTDYTRGDIDVVESTAAMAVDYVIRLRAEERLERLFELVPDLVCVGDALGRLERLGGQWQRLLGYTSEELAGARFIELVHPDDRATTERELERLLATGRSGNFVNRLRAKDGGYHSLEWQAVLLDERTVLAVARDIGERIAAESERARLREQLFQAQKMESIGALAGGVAHDFNNLLSGILSGLSLLELDLGPASRHREDLVELQGLCRRGADLTRQLLGFARRGAHAARPLDLRQVIDETARLFGRTRKDLRLRLTFAEALPAVLGDRTQLEQALLNLLVNAGQAMPAGGDVDVRARAVELSASEARARLMLPGPAVELAVQDYGVGIEPALLTRIFEPFFTTKGPGDGTGLGLASVYGIVKDHRGYVGVESAVGEGSTFTICLPANAAPIPAGAPMDGPAPSLAKGRGVALVVDDEAPLRTAYRRMLERLGFEVLTAGGGREALALVAREGHRLTLVVLDLTMPEMSGAETCAALRELAPTLAVLVASGYSLEGKAHELLGRGAAGFIQKPFDLQTLSDTLRELGLTAP